MTGDQGFVWLAAVLTGTYGIPLLYNLYNIINDIRDDIDRQRLSEQTDEQVCEPQPCFLH